MSQIANNFFSAIANPKSSDSSIPRSQGVIVAERPAPSRIVAVRRFALNATLLGLCGVGLLGIVTQFDVADLFSLGTTEVDYTQPSVEFIVATLTRIEAENAEDEAAEAALVAPTEASVSNP